MTPAVGPLRESGAWTPASAWQGRIGGLDAARAVALVGMFAAHIGDAGNRGIEADGWRWLWIADGRSSALFAVLAGVTISIMTMRTIRGAGHTAVRIAVRGVALIAAGYALDRLGTPVDVILANLGLMFLVVIPAIRWRPVVLASVGAATLVVGALVLPETEGFAHGVPVIEKIASMHYPALAWTGYVLVGMAVGRLSLRATRTAAVLAAGGAALAAVSYCAGGLLGGALPWTAPIVAPYVEPTWASIAPHSNTAFELVGNTGVALLVIGACLLAVRPMPWAFPVLAFGSMSLTMYTAHLVVIVAVGDEMVWQPSNVALVAMTLTLIAAATVWRALMGVGPLERGLTVVSTKVADAVSAPAGSSS